PSGSFRGSGVDMGADVLRWHFAAADSRRRAHGYGLLPPPARGRVGRGSTIHLERYMSMDPPARLRRSTSPFQGEVNPWHHRSMTSSTETLTVTAEDAGTRLDRVL